MGPLACLPPIAHRLVGKLGNSGFDPIGEVTEILIGAAAKGRPKRHCRSARRRRRSSFPEDSPGSLDMDRYDGNV